MTDGSNPSASATMNLLGWSEGLVHLGGSIPASNLIMRLISQWWRKLFKRGSVMVLNLLRLLRISSPVERLAVNEDVIGLNPASGAPILVQW